MTVKNALCKKDFSKKIFFWKFFKLFFKKLLTNQFFFDIICWSSRNDQILGCRQAVRHQTLTLTFPGFESLHPSQEKSRLRKQSAFFSYIRLRRVLLLRSDIRLTPSDIRFASFRGEYNITVSVANNITFA